MTDVRITRLRPEIPLPSYAHPGDAGADLVAATSTDLSPGERSLVPTGLAIELPQGFAGFIHPRSGLAARHGLSIVNAPGTIDGGFRGEIVVALINLDPKVPMRIQTGDRIAQLIVQRVEQVTFIETDALDDSARGADGYGSTGGHASLIQP